MRDLKTKDPDLYLFRDFDETLRSAFEQETRLFLASILRKDRSVLELLTANYTFVNERLAEHYGIPNVQGSYFRRSHVSSRQPTGRPAGTGQHPDADVVFHANIARAARQVCAAEPAGIATAASAAQRPRTQDRRQKRG